MTTQMSQPSQTVPAPLNTSFDFDSFNVEYKNLQMKNVRVTRMFTGTENVPRRGRKSPTEGLRLEFPDGRRLVLSRRFWPSFSKAFGLTTPVFDLFTHDEVFNRINSKSNEGFFRFTYEPNRNPTEFNAGKVLSITRVSDPVIPKNQIRAIIEEFNGSRISYQDGQISAHFAGPFSRKLDLLGKQDSTFSTGYYLNVPLDGFGTPEAFLSLLRQVCANGAVAMSNAFRTGISLGKDDVDIDEVLHRIMASFNSEEGYAALINRFETAAYSWASLGDLVSLEKQLTVAESFDSTNLVTKRSIRKALHELAGNPLDEFGFASSGEVTSKKAKLLRTKTTMYDLLNFASEIATHHMKALGARNRLYGWIGNTVCEEYNLENTVERAPAFKATHMANTVVS